MFISQVLLMGLLRWGCHATVCLFSLCILYIDFLWVLLHFPTFDCLLRKSKLHLLCLFLSLSCVGHEKAWQHFQGYTIYLVKCSLNRLQFLNTEKVDEYYVLLSSTKLYEFSKIEVFFPPRLFTFNISIISFE